jgi:leucine-zipper of insertion element IS481
LGKTRSVASGEGMKAHKNARTTPHNRQILVERVGQGLPAWQVAQDLGISRQTVHKWLARVRSGERLEGDSGLQERTSRPAHTPTRLSKSKLDSIATTTWAPMLVSDANHRSAAWLPTSVNGVLRNHNWAVRVLWKKRLASARKRHQTINTKNRQ